MGEKGNPVGLAGGTSLVTGPGVGSVIERTTFSATTTIADVGQDLAGTIADKSIGAVADNVVEAARENIHDKSAGDGPDDPPSTT
jgi:hypothetical protein